MKLPPLRIGDLTAPIPIVQGGMGIGVSLSGLASAVANEGGIGTISGALLGYEEPDYDKHPLDASICALKKEIAKARAKSPKGILAVNFLVAMNHYEKIVKSVLDQGVDLIVSGAGLPMHLPALVEGFRTKIAPIVSSGRAAEVIARLWDRNYKRTPDMVVVEGPEAGGHLGFTEESLLKHTNSRLSDLVKEVIRTLNPFREKYGRDIPVVAAGGIFTGEDICEQLESGAAGVQMSTRFVATEECDAHINFKKAYIGAREEDIVIIKSPVGMPGRALNNRFIQRIREKAEEIRGCTACIRFCNPKTAPYCISKALVRAVQGDTEGGLMFVGSNAFRVDGITTVRELISRLIREAEACYRGIQEKTSQSVTAAAVQSV